MFISFFFSVLVISFLFILIPLVGNIISMFNLNRVMSVLKDILEFVKEVDMNMDYSLKELLGHMEDT